MRGGESQSVPGFEVTAEMQDAAQHGQGFRAVAMRSAESDAYLIGRMYDHAPTFDHYMIFNCVSWRRWRSGLKGDGSCTNRLGGL